MHEQRTIRRIDDDVYGRGVLGRPTIQTHILKGACRTFPDNSRDLVRLTTGRLDPGATTLFEDSREPMYTFGGVNAARRVVRHSNALVLILPDARHFGLQSKIDSLG